jgi:hypothetical protein
MWYKALRMETADVRPGAWNCTSVIRVGVTGNFVRYARFAHAVAGSG